MTFDSVILDSHIVTTKGMLERNIIINDGKIVDFTTDIPQCDKKIQGRGLVAMPGVIDTHVHYGVYSPINEAAITESRAAALGGVTTMMRMLRLGRSYKTHLAEQLAASKTTHYVDYAIHGTIFDEKQADEMKYCVENGIKSFKLYMNLGGEIGHVYMDMDPGATDLFEATVQLEENTIRKVLANAANLGCPVLVHAEDYQMCECGIKKAKQDGKDGLPAWSQSRPPDSEVKSIRKVCQIAREFGTVIYFVHIGSTSALLAIEEERAKGTRIFVETCPHYLTLSYEKQSGYLAKVMPPIRTMQDVEQVWQAVSQNKVDTIGTDHVANRLKRKVGQDVWSSLAGFPGIGTMLPILLSEGVNKNRIHLGQLANLTSANAARIFGMFPQKGAIQKGADADIVLIDLKKEQEVRSEFFGAFSDYMVYEGWSLKGWPQTTMVRGHVVTENMQIVGKVGHGRLVERRLG
ncbi:dihydroorotase [Candidatus Nitrosotenuis uzonensis]|uniref:Amidohydrolase family protein n=1 Tax=Candidatus Nitrosotenuis uzonensis TaxID=1407055 RepID=V6AR89_9ARCH|nr:dihydroorotase family protein [Candidatus Nitrosotenuis uzonensis]CDI05099.1 putative amidohydrolase family protein [Candidatus Nitrosotenuis uzonensis]